MTAGSHRIGVGERGWSLWKWVWLRGAGFPGRCALELGSDQLERAHQALCAARRELDGAREQAIACCDAHHLADGDERARPLQYARNDLGRGRVVGHRVGLEPVDQALDALAAAATGLEAAEAELSRILEAEQLRIAGQLIARCRDPLFREALAWQNPSALANSVDGLARMSPDKDNARARERKRLVARYLQRYALKNDTIGFFGPVSWGELDADLPGVDLQPGPVVARREVAFEDWAVRALAETWSYAPESLPICSLRPKSFSWLEDGMLHRPPAPPQELEARDAQLLALAHRAPTIAELAARAVEEGGAFSSADEVYEAVRQLVKRGLATAAIEIPAEAPHGERHLRALLEQLPDHAHRAACLADLDRLEAGLAQVGAAAGDVEALRAAIARLEADFTRVTARRAKRGHGKVYAGRQIFFEDCVRGGSIRFGRSVLDPLGSPLELLLHSARWFTHEIASRYRAAFREHHAKLVASSGDAEVPLGTFLVATKALFGHASGKTGHIVRDVQEELRRRWAQVLDIDFDARQVQLHSASCRDAVLALFDAPAPGWPAARFQAPDLLLAAADVEHLQRGDFTAVLGELHVGVNTLLARVAHFLHPDRQAVLAALDADVPGERIVPVQPLADRTSTIVWSERAHQVELADGRSWRPREQVHLGGDFYVTQDQGQLRVRSRDGTRDHDVIQFMDHYLSAEASPHFDILPKLGHVPRVSIDGLVISRERWSLRRQDFSGLLAQRPRGDLFLAVRDWAAALGLPRHVFGVVPHEAKPFYVDLSSPVYVDMFLKFIASAQTLDISEMLPGHGQHWLESDDGERYSCELRLAAVDPVAWRPPEAGQP